MQYDLYIDVLFLENFVVDFFILLTVKRILACSATHASLLLGALTGAMSICLFTILPLPAAAKLFALYIPIPICMVRIGLKIHRLRELMKALFLTLLVSFLLGGIMTWLRQYLGGYFKIGSLFLTLFLCSYVLVSKALHFLENLWKLRNFHCRVTLYLGIHTCEVDAMIDSGNGLYDTPSGRPVHIIGKEAIRRLAGSQSIQQVHYIPYATIHQERGVLPVITIDRMQIHSACSETAEKIIESPLIGISEQHHFNNGTYEMILHPAEC